MSESVVTFVQQEYARLNRNASTTHFKSLVPAIERAHAAAQAAMPRPVDSKRDLWLFNTLLLCHRSFLVSVSIIGRGHPDDALGTMRCALEAAKTAFAVSYDETNWKNWLAHEERLKRWKDRQQDIVPKPVSPKLRWPKDHAILDQVGKWRGMLSDSLHFTPDFTDNHEPEIRPGEAFLSYFTDDAAEIDRALRTLAIVHCLILQVFDEALGGVLSKSEEWRAAMRSLGAIGRQLCADAGAPTEPPATNA